MARRRRMIWCPLLIVVSAIALLVLGFPPAEQQDSTTPGLLQIEDEGYLYTYHVHTGTEALFDARSDPLSLRNVLALHRVNGLRLRLKLERKLGVPRLEDLRNDHADDIRALESLGYL